LCWDFEVQNLLNFKTFGTSKPLDRRFAPIRDSHKKGDKKKSWRRLVSLSEGRDAAVTGKTSGATEQDPSETAANLYYNVPAAIRGDQMQREADLIGEAFTASRRFAKPGI